MVEPQQAAPPPVSGGPRPAKGPLWTVVVLLLLASAALWGSSRMSWGSRPADPGGVHSLGIPGAVTAQDVAPDVLVPLALLALAGIAAALASAGVARRAVGVLLGLLAAGAVGWELAAGTGRPAAPALVAGLGAALLLAAGVVLVLHGHRMPRMGARYETVPRITRSADVDRRLWDTLDDGRDPTAEPSKDLGTQGGFPDPTPGPSSQRG